MAAQNQLALVAQQMFAHKDGPVCGSVEIGFKQLITAGGAEAAQPMAVTFAIIHLSYGLGFLVGLVKFWNRWTDRGQWKTLASRPGREESINTR